MSSSSSSSKKPIKGSTKPNSSTKPQDDRKLREYELSMPEIEASQFRMRPTTADQIYQWPLGADVRIKWQKDDIDKGNKDPILTPLYHLADMLRCFFNRSVNQESHAMSKTVAIEVCKSASALASSSSSSSSSATATATAASALPTYLEIKSMYLELFRVSGFLF